MSAKMGMPLDYIFLLLQNNEDSIAGFFHGLLKTVTRPRLRICYAGELQASCHKRRCKHCVS